MIHDDPTPCFGRSDLFDATDLSSHYRAKELCGVCPVIDACRQNLLETRRSQIIAGHGPEGTWAGLLLRPRAARGAK